LNKKLDDIHRDRHRDKHISHLCYKLRQQRS